MFEDLAEALNVDKSTVSNRLYTIQKERFKKIDSMNCLN